MGWLDLHRKRTMNEGGNIRIERERETVAFVEQNFKDSPSYKLVDIDGVPFHTRLLLDKRYNMAVDVETKMLLLLPYETVERGQMVNYDDEDWLIVFFNRMDLKPRVHMRYCSETLDFPNGNSYPCVIDNKLQGFQTVTEFKPINLPADSLQITVQYNEDTKRIQELDRFIFNEGAFEVQAFDRVRNVYKGVGIMDVIVRKVPLTEKEIAKIEGVDMEEIIKDYNVTIQGYDEVEVNTVEQYIGKIYLDGNLTTEEVVWSVDGKASIAHDGTLTVSNETGITEITASFTFRNSEGIGEVVKATKQVKIVDNDDDNWGWA